MPLTVVILGHSFTRRLRDWSVTERKSNMNLDPQRIQVIWHGIGGAYVHPPPDPNDTVLGPKSLWDHQHIPQDVAADITFIDIGSNDVTNPQLSPVALAHSIMKYASAVLQNGCKIVVLSEILHRRQGGGYNQRADATNLALQQLSGSNDRILFWSHRRNNFNRRFISEFVAADGVHVACPVGMSHYFRSVRGAVIYAENLLSAMDL